MTKKRFLATMAAFPAAAAAAAAQTGKAKHKTVFQMTEPKGQAWDTLFRGLANLQDAFAKDGGVEIAVVCFRVGVTLLKKDNEEFAERLRKAHDSGVTFNACQHAMAAMNLKSADMSPIAVEVDAGVAEMTRRQEAGFAVIH